MTYKRDTQSTKEIKSITISLASPESILENSYGEVVKPETINYRTLKPEPDGLFCERIFGPVKDWECHCGKYKRIRYKGIVCDRCGVEVAEKKVRRDRMGHIELVIPVAHIWYFRPTPNKIGALLGLKNKELDSVIYYEKYIVINPGPIANLKDEDDKPINGSMFMDLITEEEYRKIQDKIASEKVNELNTDVEGNIDDNENNTIENTEDGGDKFIAKMGAEAVFDLLNKIDLDAEAHRLRHAANTETSQQRKKDALKRLKVFEAFREANVNMVNKPEWMIVKIVPVIPPELRPLVPLDGGRFASSDLNDLYRRVIIRNNRLKRFVDIKAPDIMVRHEKRLLQEAVDSLFDNSRKSTSKSENDKKSLSESLKGKQGRFRQNLLGKRVDYSGRSVIVVGPELKLNECGLPKEMASELYKPFIIRKLIERGIVKTVKSAKKIVDRKDAVVWDILENILKGHPVLLNRAPTLHRLGIQAFQPKLIEGKAIQLHPLACTAFNADFDGDQMAVHVPLGNAAILEAQLLMLASHNILNPANGAPITVPSQDMVLGLYYMTKEKRSTPEEKVKGEGFIFYSPEEVIIAYNEKRIDLHACIKVRIENPETKKKELVDTTVGRVLFNEVMPENHPYVNELLTKKHVRNLIGDVLKKTGSSRTAQFLDDIKELGYTMSFKGGLSFNLNDIIIPADKPSIIAEADEQVEDIWNQYNNGFITDNERYNKVIDVWGKVTTRLTNSLISTISTDRQGFNPIWMMLESGARGSNAQIRQLAGLRGLMQKPQKSSRTGGETIENPILSNFKEGLSVLEYFISTHGARKGLADTALKTADAGYLTRRLVDVAQDAIISEEDCGTLRGISTTAYKVNEEVKEELSKRILGRVALNDVYDPNTGELIIKSNEEISEEYAKQIEDAGIESVEIRSVLTCEAKHGICAKCYGRNLATSKMVQRGEAVGVIAAQSIGEPGTQLTLRTFHVGGVASNIGEDASIIAKYDGILQIKELRCVPFVDKDNDSEYDVVLGRYAEMTIVNEKTGIALTSAKIPYGAKLYFKNEDKVQKGEIICEWDQYNSSIISDVPGKVSFVNLGKDEENITYEIHKDEQINTEDMVIIESKQKFKAPMINILNNKDEVVKSFDLPVNARIKIKDNSKVKAGEVLVKIPRQVGKSGDITGGLHRVNSLFEARKPSDPAIASEIDGIVSLNKKLKRGGKREITVTPKFGPEKKYVIPTSKHILVEENDFVKAGTLLSEGVITPADILAIKGPTEIQEYLVNEIQDVYRLQGVMINDKHFEIIVRQMMRKVQVIDSGDTKFIEEELVNKLEFNEENDWIFSRHYIEDKGDSENYEAGQLVSARAFREENSMLKRRDKQIMKSRPARPATAQQVLQGITYASLQTDSWISAASFQETTKVLRDASIKAKSDYLLGLKENVIVGGKIPAGTGLRKYQNLVVSEKDETAKLSESYK